MKDPYIKRYLYLMLAIFGAISLSIVVFFAVFRFQGIGDGLRTLSEILAPFIYGSVVAYLLCATIMSDFSPNLCPKVCGNCRMLWLWG